MSMVAGNGQDGLVSAGVMRVSASMPSVSVTVRGIDARLRGDRPRRPQFQPQRRHRRAGVVPCSGIERQALAHCTRAFCSKAGSLRMRACTSAICSATFLSISGLTCAGTLTRAPATLRLVSPRLTCAARFGSMRQFAAIFGRADDDDVALDLGAGVEVLDVHAADLLGDVAAEQAAERVADRAGRLRRQRAGDVERARQRRRQRQHVLRAGRA